MYPKMIYRPGFKPLHGQGIVAHDEDEEARILAAFGPAPETADSMVKRLSDFLRDTKSDQIKTDESAVDCAIRLLSSDAPTIKRGPGRPPKATSED
jgi:hypothetical protein